MLSKKGSSSILSQRRKSKAVMLGQVQVGGDAPITVQSMTNTRTEDLNETSQQIDRLVAAGAEIIRISVPTAEAALAFSKLLKRTSVPLVADIHFDYRLALQVIAAGAAGVRINPGNIGPVHRTKSIVEACKQQGTVLRIGVNAGSLERDLLARYREPTAAALVESALRQAAILNELNFDHFKVSIKSSDLATTVEACRSLAHQIEQPLHLGITEAGTRRTGTVKASVGLGILLSEGIGDTLRVSLTDEPEEEVRVGFELLKSLELRHRGIRFISCPTCARSEFDVIGVVKALEARFEHVIEPIEVSIIGCCVNGHGEAKQSTIGIVGRRDASSWYVNGIKQSNHLNNHQLVELIAEQIEWKLKQLASS